MPRAADGPGGINGNDVPGHQPIEQHSNPGQMLFDSRGRSLEREILDIGRDGDGTDRVQVQSPAIAPLAELADSLGISGACVSVTDRHDEELCKPSSGMIAGTNNEVRQLGRPNL